MHQKILDRSTLFWSKLNPPVYIMGPIKMASWILSFGDQLSMAACLIQERSDLTIMLSSVYTCRFHSAIDTLFGYIL